MTENNSQDTPQGAAPQQPAQPHNGPTQPGPTQPGAAQPGPFYQGQPQQMNRPYGQGVPPQAMPQQPIYRQPGAGVPPQGVPQFRGQVPPQYQQPAGYPPQYQGQGYPPQGAPQFQGQVPPQYQQPQGPSQLQQQVGSVASKLKEVGFFGSDWKTWSHVVTLVFSFFGIISLFLPLVSVRSTYFGTHNFGWLSLNSLYDELDVDYVNPVWLLIVVFIVSIGLTIAMVGVGTKIIYQVSNWVILVANLILFGLAVCVRVFVSLLEATESSFHAGVGPSFTMACAFVLVIVAAFNFSAIESYKFKDPAPVKNPPIIGGQPVPQGVPVQHAGQQQAPSPAAQGAAAATAQAESVKADEATQSVTENAEQGSAENLAEAPAEQIKDKVADAAETGTAVSATTDVEAPFVAPVESEQSGEATQADPEAETSKDESPKPFGTSSDS